jgi:hypothetical protein
MRKSIPEGQRCCFFSFSIPLRHPERSQRTGDSAEYSRRAKRCSFFSFSIPLRHPERGQRTGDSAEYSRRAKRCSFFSFSIPPSVILSGSCWSRRISAKRFSTIVFERRFLPRPLFHGRGGRVAERLGGEGSATRHQGTFLGSPFLQREGGQGVRFRVLTPTRLFPFPYGKGLGVRLPRAPKNLPVHDHA